MFQPPGTWTSSGRSRMVPPQTMRETLSPSHSMRSKHPQIYLPNSTSRPKQSKEREQQEDPYTPPQHHRTFNQSPSKTCHITFAAQIWSQDSAALSPAIICRVPPPPPTPPRRASIGAGSRVEGMRLAYGD